MGEQDAVGRLSLLPEGDQQLLDGRYQLIGEIASGGMASVFLARRAGVGGFQRMVAIKRLHPHLAREQEFIDMFLDEARIAASIHHRNVVPILEIGASDTGYYLVMEYIEGVTLAKLMTHAAVVEEPLPAPTLLRTVVDALGGLHAAHELTDDTGEALNVVHRDCSPQNLLIGLDGSTRITDFGIARARSRLHTTREGAMKGKLAYMAPEQTQGDEFDRRADTFSVGVVLWEMLSQRRLFKGKTEAQTLRRLLDDVIPPIQKYAPDIPKPLDDVCQKALQRDPSKRYQTAAEMADAIEAAAKNNIGVATHREVEVLMKERYGADANEQRDAVRTWLQATPTAFGLRGGTTDHGWGGRERSAIETRPPPISGRQLPATTREGSEEPPGMPPTRREGSEHPPPPSRQRRNVITQRGVAGASDQPLSAPPPTAQPPGTALPPTELPSTKLPSSSPVATPPAGTGAMPPMTTRSWPPEGEDPSAPQKVSRPPPKSTLVSAGQEPVLAPSRPDLVEESNDETHIYEASSVGITTDRPPPAGILTTGAAVPVMTDEPAPPNKSRWPLLVAAIFALFTAAVLVLRTTGLIGHPDGSAAAQPAELDDEPSREASNDVSRGDPVPPVEPSAAPSVSDPAPSPEGDNASPSPRQPQRAPVPKASPRAPAPATTPAPAAQPAAPSPPVPPSPPSPPSDEEKDLSNPYR